MMKNETSGKYRNIRLQIETYYKLDRYLRELNNKENKTRSSLDHAIDVLLKEHYGEM